MLLRNKNLLCIGGFDPSGAAGVLADSRMATACGAHVSALISTQTLQGRRRLHSSQPTSLTQLQDELAAIRADTPIHAVKLGAIATAEQAQWLSECLPNLGCPVVMDPVLLASSGTSLIQANALEALRGLAQQVSVVTPNRAEAHALFGINPDAPQWTTNCTAPILATGSDHAQAQQHTNMTHRLLHHGHAQDFVRPVRAGRYRGSGCLLATALACALIDQEHAVEDSPASRFSTLATACDQALATVDLWLASAWSFADGVHLPQRPA